MMKSNYIKYFSLLAICLFFAACGKLDYENKEFYKQELYIVNAESTSASERSITAIQAYTFVDTLKILNDNYDVELIEDLRDGFFEVKFKVGIGGSLTADKDIPVKVAFDQETLTDFNIENNTAYYIPESLLYKANAPYDPVTKSFTVTIKKGTASSALIFAIPIKRMDSKAYSNFAFPVRIVEGNSIPQNRFYDNFLIANLIVDAQKVVNWSGFPIPKLPEGRYHSARLQANAAENNVNGVHYNYKYITRLSNDPNDKDQFMIWGTGLWSFEVFGLHGNGWMYNKLFLNDEAYGTYTLEPIAFGDNKFPQGTFAYATTQGTSTDNTYDPKTKTLVLHYKNIIGQDYTDVLTYIDDKLDIRDANTSSGPHNWQYVRQQGYKNWLPIDGK
ncbi:DUF1735 domain-containing protein [Sphingobacterium sp. BIGb0165]|uniref:DUF1735 domain-containing protein n=1 Tax=Sphingobacterium sp. BIGb0165 TaxID=2940615 RepID=UPI002169D4A4|nr:DUF1735 domain-containing protein [Sphingobacterium sp. BIGb0165]MCS4225815.1 hypothetical protein [Sphingobacterium sp. BIGb0165]